MSWGLSPFTSVGRDDPNIRGYKFCDYLQRISVGVTATAKDPSIRTVVNRVRRSGCKDRFANVGKLNAPLTHALGGVPFEHSKLAEARRALREPECFIRRHGTNVKPSCEKRKFLTELARN